MLASIEKTGKYDWILIAVYFFLVVFGWLNIFSATYSDENHFIFDFSQKYGMQFIWMLSAFFIAFLILFVIPDKIYNVFPPLLYIFVLILLFAVIFIGKEVNGSKSWFLLGPISFQPAEVSKISTSLFLAYTMSKHGFRLSQTRDLITALLIIFVPIICILMEKETGSALVYIGFILMFYREGLTGWILVFGFLSILFFVLTLKFSPIISLAVLVLLAGIWEASVSRKFIKRAIPLLCFVLFLIFLPDIQSFEFMAWSRFIKPEYWALIFIVPTIASLIIKNFRKRIPYFKPIISTVIVSILLIFSVDFIFNNILQPHQRGRIENLLGITEDIKGIGYNVHQSKIAIGSGGFIGKGFLNGTQTKYNFVPEQSTDFIFCTIGEEWGFLGGTIIICLYLFLICRIISDAEKQKDNFTRIYGYCIASCFFMHVFINIGMTMGIVPVIGIPLPFLSYGGSSLWSFTIMLFIFIRLQQQRRN